eukprot:jgi/Astpho2/6951/Aster-01813
MLSMMIMLQMSPTALVRRQELIPVRKLQSSRGLQRLDVSAMARAGDMSPLARTVNFLTVLITQSPLHEGKKRFFIGRAGNYDEQAAQQELEALISQHSVVTFGWTFCPFARRAKELLAELGADFEAVELNQLSQGPALRAELIKKTNRTSVPNVFINGASFGGLNDGPGILTLHKEGQLEPLLREAGALKS